MHPNMEFRWPRDKAIKDAEADRLEREALVSLITEIGFGLVFADTENGPRVAHVPLFYTGDGALQFHLSKGNALTRELAGKTALCVINGPEAYISPDWYEDPAQVPTWNYIALELEGPVRAMEKEGLIAQLDDLTTLNEAKLEPKKPWHRDKMEPKIFDKMTDAIIGFEMEIIAWRPTAKLSQNKSQADRLKVADALETQGRRAMAHMMRNLPK